MNLKLGHIESKSRSLGPIIEKQGFHSRGHSTDTKFMKLRQNVNPHNISVKFETVSKTRSQGQIITKNLL